jgi:hypothetical protein
MQNTLGYMNMYTVCNHCTFVNQYGPLNMLRTEFETRVYLFLGYYRREKTSIMLLYCMSYNNLVIKLDHTGFEPTPLIHCSTIYIYIYIYIYTSEN